MSGKALFIFHQYYPKYNTNEILRLVFRQLNNKTNITIFIVLLDNYNLIKNKCYWHKLA